MKRITIIILNSVLTCWPRFAESVDCREFSLFQTSIVYPIIKETLIMKTCTVTRTLISTIVEHSRDVDSPLPSPPHKPKSDSSLGQPQKKPLCPSFSVYKYCCGFLQRLPKVRLIQTHLQQSPLWSSLVVMNSRRRQRHSPQPPHT